MEKVEINFHVCANTGPGLTLAQHDVLRHLSMV